MVVDKDLFLYDLAVVTIIKNEARYIAEWLDYHLLAGVDHFYLYDNDSNDNTREILQPYIDAGVVTCKFYPGKARQYEAFNEAVQDYKFFCRYMAFIDADEFIFPQDNRSIVEVVDEVFQRRGDIGGLTVNWHMFGSNYQDTADYTLGVLERFVRRAEKCDSQSKTIADPRRINYFYNPHFAVYYKGFLAVNERCEPIPGPYNEARTDEKILINHYHLKSREEFQIKVNRGTSDAYHNTYKMDRFSHEQGNDVLDDSILRYRDARRDAISQRGGVVDKNNFLATKAINYNRVSDAVIKNVAPMFAKKLPQDFFNEKLGLFLTCWKVSTTFQQELFNETAGDIFTKASLNAVSKSINAILHLADVMILLKEMPNILTLDEPVIKDIRASCINVIPQIKNLFRYYDQFDWKEFVDLDYTMRMLQSFEAYDKKQIGEA